MTDERKKLLNELLAEKKREERQKKKDAEFFAEVDSRRDEILSRWSINVDKRQNFNSVKNMGEVNKGVQGEHPAAIRTGEPRF